MTTSCTYGNSGTPCVVIRRFACVLLLAALTFSLPVQAFTIHYDGSRSVAIRACDNLVYRGKDDEATACYTQLLDDSDGLEQADAAAALGNIRQANGLYRELAANDNDPAIKTHWGQLYLETHQVSDAEALFREALLYDENWLPARVGLAQTLAEGFEGRARELLETIIEEHPDNVHSLLLLARIELELQNLERGRELLGNALSAAEVQGHPALEIYALNAGANLLEKKPMTQWVEKALEFNP